MADLSKKRADYAVFLPAISGFYTEIHGRSKHIEGYLKPERIPEKFENGLETLNFLNPEKGAFFYDRCLYSAGHAYLDLEKSDKLEGLVQERHESVVCVGDSGGYQVGRGIIKFDWANVFEKEGDEGYVGDADKTRLKLLRWLEHTAEWSMTLDVPSWAHDTERKKQLKSLQSKTQTDEVKKEIAKIEKKMTGLNNAEECLAATVHNLEFFLEHRTPGATKFLNVLQGNNQKEADAWYEAVKHYECEGWAMGGNNIRDVSMTLKRLLTMRDEGLLEGKDWIHFLGTSKLNWAIMLTAIQRQIRKHINPNLTISYDCASPYLAAANGLVYTHNINLTDKFSYLMQNCFDDRRFKNSEIPFPFEGAIGDTLTVGDICTYGLAHAVVNGEIDYKVTEEEVTALVEAGIDAKWVPADLNRIGKQGKTSWDSFSYSLLMAHNTEMHIKATQRSNQLADIEHFKFDLDWRNYRKTKKKDKSQEKSKWIPVNILYFMQFVEELFVAKDPYSLLDEAADFLADFNNNKIKDDVISNTHFNSLFGEAEVDTSIDEAEDVDFESSNDGTQSELIDNLDDLENQLRDE